MSSIPRDPALESGPAILKEGYRFVSNRCKRYGTDAFEIRMMLRKAVCVRGEAGARMFYTPGRFTREGALPPTTLKLLQDKGSALTLNDGAHRCRKHMFMALMGPERVAAMGDYMEAAWTDALPRWEAMDQVPLLWEVRKILCRAACRWAGVPLAEDAVAPRARELGAMIDGAGSFGLKNLRGMRLRARTEKWAGSIIDRIRKGELKPDEGTAAQMFALQEGPDGARLHHDIAAIELINILRPTVAVGRYIIFSALALHQFPECRKHLQAEDGGDCPEYFAQEVRRYYPFFPFVAGRVREPFEWRGYHFKRGLRVVLDLYGTNHDPKLWESPDAFRPERFRERKENPFDLIPQGGGDHMENHRCPGEAITVELMQRAARLLARSMDYTVPEQDLTVDLSKFPALPESGFRISGVQKRTKSTS